MLMESAFRKWGQWIRLANILGGSTAFAALLSHVPARFGLYGAALLAIATALDIVTGFDRRSFEHGQLRKDYTNLLKRLSAGEDAKTVRQDYYAIEAEEGPGIKAIINRSHNDALRMMGYRGRQYDDFKARIMPWQWPVLWLT